MIDGRRSLIYLLIINTSLKVYGNPEFRVYKLGKRLLYGGYTAVTKRKFDSLTA